MFPKTNTIQENYDHYHETENLSDVDPHFDITSIENQIQDSLERFEEPLTEPLTEPLKEPLKEPQSMILLYLFLKFSSS